MHVELVEHVARGQRCGRRGVPRVQNMSSGVWVFFDTANYARDLVYSLTRVVCVTVLVLCAKVSPEEPVDAACI